MKHMAFLNIVKLGFWVFIPKRRTNTIVTEDATPKIPTQETIRMTLDIVMNMIVTVIKHQSTKWCIKLNKVVVCTIMLITKSWHLLEDTY